MSPVDCSVTSASVGVGPAIFLHDKINMLTIKIEVLTVIFGDTSELFGANNIPVSLPRVLDSLSSLSYVKQMLTSCLHSHANCWHIHAPYTPGQCNFVFLTSVVERVLVTNQSQSCHLPLKKSESLWAANQPKSEMKLHTCTPSVSRNSFQKLHNKIRTHLFVVHNVTTLLSCTHNTVTLTHC
jgi:hypothetical protein